MRRARHALVLALGSAPSFGLALASACSVDDLDVGGKQCPCLSGFVCDVASNRCVLSGAGSDAAADAAGDERGPPLPLLVISNLTAAWTTPGSMRWEWKLAGAAADFRAYEIVTGASADDVVKRVGVDVVTSTERSELGVFDARGGKAQGPIDMWTLLDVRGPAIKQFVQVTVTDVKGRASRSLIAPATSALRATSQAILFDGATQKTAVPSAEFVFRAPAGGEAHYALVTDCAGAKACGKRAELVSLGSNLAPAGSPFTSSHFDASFLELEVDGNVAVTAFDTSVALEIGAGCTLGPGLCRYRFTGWTQPPTSRTKLQVPLRELQNDAGKLTYAALQGKKFIVDAVALSGTWKNQSTINLYNARIRW